MLSFSFKVMNTFWTILNKIGLLVGIPLVVVSIVAICWQYKDRTQFKGNLNVSSESIKIIFGSNTFIGTPNILVINNQPILSAEIKDSKLFVYLKIYDKEGKIVAQINGNEWTVNQNNFYTIDKSSNYVKVTNQYGETALEASIVTNDTIKINGTFYINGKKIVATDAGLSL